MTDVEENKQTAEDKKPALSETNDSKPEEEDEIKNK